MHGLIRQNVIDQPPAFVDGQGTLRGQPVWIGQISRDIGVGFIKNITTHKIDPDVDEIRELLLEHLAYSQARLFYVYSTQLQMQMQMRIIELPILCLVMYDEFAEIDQPRV
jgi:hypothetical protein